jgi:hypothetical protein
MSLVEPRVGPLPDGSEDIQSHLQVVTSSVDDRKGGQALIPTTLLLLTLEERQSLARLEDQEREHRRVMAVARQQAQEARRSARSQAALSGSSVRAGRPAFLRRLFTPAPPCPDVATD